MPFAPSGGVRIHYEVEGNGAPLLLHHGFSGSLKVWRRSGYVDALKGRFRLILIDARGHGQSDKPHDPAAYELERQASDVMAVLDHLSLERAHYWGYSMGGRIAFAIALQAPQRVHSLVIGAAHPYSRTLPPGERPDGSDPQAFVAALYKRTGSDLSALPPEVREDLFANDFRALAAVQGNWPPMEHVLPWMAMPTMLYVGDRDPYLEKVRKCAAAISGARMLELPGLDHATVFRESALVLPAVTRFLAEAQ
jgi:pimeloyl-ACP methyl ester carboxylesterase